MRNVGKLHMMSIVGGIIGYYLFFQSFYNMTAYHTVLPYENFKEGCISVVSNFIPILLTIISTWVIVFFCPGFKRVSLKIIIDTFLCFAFLASINFAFSLIRPGVELDRAGTVFNSVIVLLGMETIYYVLHFRKTLQENEKQRALALQYQYDLLKAQINPHFLFNSLNLLYSLVDIDQQKTKEFTMALSNMYRYLLVHQGKETVPLSMELEFLNDYIHVLSIRYSNLFQVNVNGQENIKDNRIVPFTMQLLIENVTKHNAINKQHRMLVEIDIKKDSICITNPIARRQTESGKGIGLKNIARLYSQWGKMLTIENDGHTFRAMVPFVNVKTNIE